MQQLPEQYYLLYKEMLAFQTQSVCKEAISFQFLPVHWRQMLISSHA